MYEKTSKRTLGRVVFVILAIAVQVIWLILTLLVFRSRVPIATPLLEIISVLAVLWLVKITPEDCRKKNMFIRIGQSILRLFAPLL